MSLLILLWVGLFHVSAADDRAAWTVWVATQEPGPHPEPAYRFLADVHVDLAAAVARRPGRVEVEELGRTVRGEPIWAFHVRDPATPPRQKRLFFAQIHALEWITTEVAVAFLLRVLEHPPPGVAVTVIPVLNVDGRRKVEADLAAGEDVYRRGNAGNVDLNRDFAVNREATAVWRHLLPRRYATSPGPLSQPESRALDRLAARERFDVAVSLHAWGGYLYYPWAGRWQRPADRADFERLGHVMKAGQGARAYRVQQLGRWAFFFRGHGMEIDHLYGAYGTRAFLVELTRSGRSLWKPSTWGPDFRIYNPVDPGPAVARGVGALRALAAHLAGQPTPGLPRGLPGTEPPGLGGVDAPAVRP